MRNLLKVTFSVNSCEFSEPAFSNKNVAEKIPDQLCFSVSCPVFALGKKQCLINDH